MSFLTTIGNAIWVKLEPRVDRLLNEATELIRKELAEQIPILVKAAVEAGVKAGTDLANDGVDKLTNAIPGTLDDQIIDPIAKRITDELRKALGF